MSPFTVSVLTLGSYLVSVEAIVASSLVYTLGARRGVRAGYRSVDVSGIQLEPVLGGVYVLQMIDAV